MSFSDSKLKGMKFGLHSRMYSSGGCGGFSYHFDVEPKTSIVQSDKEFKQGGQSIVVDDVSMSFLKDCEVDYHEEMVRSSFRVVKNSMADSSCGCGSSFSVGS